MRSNGGAPPPVSGAPGEALVRAGELTIDDAAKRRLSESVASGSVSSGTAAAGESRVQHRAGDAAAAAHLAAARRILAIIFGPPAERSFGVRLWDGSLDGEPPAASRVTLVIRRPGALRRALLPPSELALVEAYLREDFDAEGDIEATGVIADLVARRLRSPRALWQLACALVRLPAALPDESPPDAHARRVLALANPIARHSRQRAASAVRHHYDVGDDFYALWLDERFIYSCAYFPTGTETLDAAQEAKLELVCRKLRLRAGEHLLDVGCGWGGLLEYAATRYAISGVGITLSEPQAAAARARLAAAGVGDRVQVEVRDYRDLPDEWTFDKIVSVGMREHVGAARLPAYFAALHRALRPGGLFLDHGVVRGGMAETRSALAWLERRLWRRDAFIQRYVFPDGELVPLGALLQTAERAGLEARDMENLREHYVRTLRHWVARLDGAHLEAAALVGEHAYRVWRFYMAATTLGFLTGRITLVQTLFAKPRADGTANVPPSRADLYE